eukprot:927865-Prymnesium_polylepis.1
MHDCHALRHTRGQHTRHAQPRRAPVPLCPQATPAVGAHRTALSSWCMVGEIRVSEKQGL